MLPIPASGIVTSVVQSSTSNIRKRRNESARVLTTYLKPAKGTYLPRVITSLPVALQKCLISFLKFSEQGIFSQVCRDWHQHVGNSPMYATIMRNLTVTQHTRRSNRLDHLTFAGRLHRLITTEDNKIAMSLMAEALTRGDLTRSIYTYVRRELLHKVGTGNSSPQARSRCYEVRARHLLFGYGVRDPVDLVDQLNVEFWRRPQPDINKKAKNWLILYAFGVWGYLDLKNMERAAAARLNPLRKTSIQPCASISKIEALIGDFLDFLVATNDKAKLAAIEKLQDHVKNAANNSEWYDDPNFFIFTPLIPFAQLTVIQHKLSTQTPQSTCETIQQLIQLCDSPSVIPHIRALAEITLAHERYAVGTPVVTDEEVCLRLRRFIDQHTLRTDVRPLAEVLLALFHLQNRVIDPDFKPDQASTAARVILGERPLAGTQGMLSNRRQLADDMLKLIP